MTCSKKQRRPTTSISMAGRWPCSTVRHSITCTTTCWARHNWPPTAIRESGWNHNGFRDYAPQLGRYVEPDPLGRLGSGNNLYAYVDDNPTNFTDPLGLCAIRKLDPNSRECKELAAKIANIVADIQSSTSDLATNPLTLPEAPPFPGAPRRTYVQGHRELLDEKIQNLANRANEYNEKCGGGDPFASVAPASAPGSVPSAGPSVSPFVVVGGAVIIGGTIILCPECFVVAPVFAF